MTKLFIKIRSHYTNKREFRQALPIAARIMEVRVSAQARGYDCDVDYVEIADEAIKLTRAVKQEIYGNGGVKRAN